jgi:hypothetical protein
MRIGSVNPPVVKAREWCQPLDILARYLATKVVGR